MKYLEDESDDIISEGSDDSQEKNEPFIDIDKISVIDEIDEEGRTIIIKRVKNREVKFNNLSLGDDFMETFCDQLKKNHNIQKFMVSNNRLTSRGAMAVMNKVSYSTNYLDISGNQEIKIDAYKFLSKYILQDYRK